MEDGICRKLIATYQEEKLFLGERRALSICVKDITIDIEQLGIRKITVLSEQEVPTREIYAVFTYIERLIMLFDGRFLTLSELSFEDSAGGTSDKLKRYAYHYMNNRLSYFKSADFCIYPQDKLIDYESVITTEMYMKWKDLLGELDIVHQMFLYSTSDSKMPVDAKCAFLIELAEPLVEIVQTHMHLYSSLTPGERGTSLRMCVDALISKYGTVIFTKEINKNYEMFLKVIVNSRVRVMHIKRYQNNNFLDGKESILYAKKMSLLYRVILFEILGINMDKYNDNLKMLINKLDEWDDVQEGFLTRI